MRFFFLGILMLFAIYSGKGQFNTVDQQLIWLGAGIDADLSQKFSVGIFAEERRFIFPGQRQQRVWLDLHAKYQHSSNWKLTGGLWLFEISSPQIPFLNYVGEIKETRPYFSLEYSLPLANGHKWQFALQSEYRIFRPLAAESFFEGDILREDIRERVKIAYEVPVGKSSSLNLAEELHFTVYSTDEQIVFNQNRLMATFKHKFGKGLSAAAGYIFWFQPTGNEAEYFARHIASFRINYRFKLYSGS